MKSIYLFCFPMAFSTIIPKHCKCSPDCRLYPSIGFKGYNESHAPNEIREEKISRLKQRAKQRNGEVKTGRELRKLAVEQPQVKAGKDYAELERWFKERQKEMTGKCMNCGGKTEKDTKNYKCSIGHILPKAYFKSVATHPDNWIELCFYGNSCHTNFDNKMIDIIDLHCFDTVIQKFTKIYSFIAPEEKRRIPPILIEYLKTEI